MWSVIYSNYFPREVDSYWTTKEEAEAQRDRLNDEDELGSRMWEVEEIEEGGGNDKQRST